MLLPHRFHRLTLALGVISAIGCGGGDVTVPPTAGTLEITTSTGGSEQDTDGYSVQVDAAPAQAIGAAATLTIADLSPGTHTVQLGEVAVTVRFQGITPGRSMSRREKQPRLASR